MKGYRHFDWNDRRVIQAGLENGDSFKQIAEALGKHPTSVANEVKRYRTFKKCGAHGSAFNDCSNRFTCSKSDLCGSPQCRRRHCRYCSRCSEHCGEYVQELCRKLEKPPYVCSGCRQKIQCTLGKAFYDAGDANHMAMSVLAGSRSGINADADEVARLDAVITPLVKRGQSLYHIIHTVGKDAALPAERTLYSYVENGVLQGICSIDLPRQVRYKKRYKKRTPADTSCRIGRTRTDFLKFMGAHPDTPLVQMDSVVDHDEKHSLLTLHFVEACMMLAYIREGDSAQSVISILDMLTESLGLGMFRRLFPVILTDNGSEFKDVARLEATASGEERTKVFFCDPYASYQKGAIENNHEMIRRVLPKGTDFTGLTQGDIAVMMDNINSYKRKKLNGRSPYDLFSFLHGDDSVGLFKALGIRRIEPDKITLTKRLFCHSQRS